MIVVPPPNPDQAMPQTPADILKAIGEALSCGAENFENLTQTERARCKREPWVAHKLPNGTIVLEAAESVDLCAAARPAQTVRRRCHAPSDCRPRRLAPSCCNVPCVQTTPIIGIPTN